MRRRPLWSALFVVTCVASQVLVGQQPPSEYDLKAAFVSKFPQFVEWPGSALDGHTTFSYCVARPNPFGRALDNLLSGEMLQGRRPSTREVGSADEIGACQVLFVSDRAAARQTALLAAASGLPILTVGESDDFLEAGGIINLRVVGGRIRFEVDAAAAARARLRLSAQLLQLAIAVRGASQ
jgi:hypothetical protein